jgi:uncharacterized membrane protein
VERIMSVTACRKFALEQNLRLFDQAHQLNRRAHALLDHADLDADTFNLYLAIKRKAERQYRHAIEHLQLINREFAEPEFATLPPIRLKELPLATL